MPPYTTFARVVVYRGAPGRLYRLGLILATSIIPFHLALTKGHLRHERPTGRFFARLEHAKGMSIGCSDDVVASGEQCQHHDWLHTVEATGGSQAEIHVTTFVQERIQERVCDTGVPRGSPRSCPEKMDLDSLWRHVEQREYYVASPETFNILVEHSIGGVGPPVSGAVLSQNWTKGKLRPLSVAYPSAADDSVQFFSWSTGRDTRGKISLSRLLALAGVALTDPHPDSESGRSFRRTGVQVNVVAATSNLWRDIALFNIFGWFTPGKVRSLWQPTWHPVSEGVRKIRTEPLPAGPNGAARRIMRRAYGVRIVFHEYNLIGEWDTLTFLTYVVAALTFLTMPWNAVEALIDAMPALATRVGPNGYIGRFVHRWCSSTQQLFTSDERRSVSSPPPNCRESSVRARRGSD
eukprot:TRINITY_DN69979_c0_g1_i1.p1 TRINITY_DN69979_c0_g1~~TRINITY_DN69979_c0_g1_i1.p1  ORF type:complete len:408 (+),score=48.38 TRINITY_DN69979_c0_g1_i1:95-1318(+)